MSHIYFSGTTIIHHPALTLYRQDVNRDRIQLVEENSAIEFQTLSDPSGVIYNRRYPFDAVFTSTPILVNAESFPEQDPRQFVQITDISSGCNYQIEFRAANDINMQDGVTDWKSINSDSFLPTNDIVFDFANDWDAPLSTDDVLEISLITSGLYINAKNPNAVGELGYLQLRSNISGNGTFTNDYGTFLTMDIECSRAGPILEVAVLHQNEYNESRTDLKDIRRPYKHLIHVDEANRKQHVVWSIVDWPAETNRIDAIKALAFKPLEGENGSFDVDITNVRLYNRSRRTASPVYSGISFPITGEFRYLQYRLAITRTNADQNVLLSGVQFVANTKKVVLPQSLMRHNKYIDQGVVNYADRSGMRLVY